MCGRFVLASDPDVYARHLRVDAVVGERLARSWNVAPTDRVYVAVEHHQERLLGPMRWGLIPPWSTDPRRGHINARLETVATKPAFRQSLARRRCLIPADGFYEWETTAEGRRPHLIRRADGSPLVFAGLWSGFTHSDTGERTRTCAIVTTAASGPVARLHHRMPVVLPPGTWERWLDPHLTDPFEAEGLLTAGADLPEVVIDAVSREVNDVRNNGPQLLAPAGRSDQAG
jgi:putative SOS response-associated peptidase YedK